MNYKTNLLIPALLVLFQSVGLYAGPDWVPPVQDYEKKFSETYNVNSQGSVRLENRYGEINVETWEQNQVRIDVRIKVTANSQDKANQTFDRITIDFTGGANRATATTNIGNSNDGTSFFGRVLKGDWSWDSNNSGDFKIYYTVKMPASATLETIAKYCDVRLPNLSGNNTTTVAYGDLVAGKLSGSNDVQISYGSIRTDELGKMSKIRLRYSEATVRKADVLTYDGRYSEAEIGTVSRIRIDAGYEDIEIEEAGDVYIRGNYNDIEINTVGSLDVDGNYSDYSLKRVTKSIKASSGYGDIDIEEIGPNFESIEISTRYADVSLGMPNGRGYDVDINTRYGDISVRGRGDLKRNEEGSSESVKGKVHGTGTGFVNVTTSYGDVVLR